ncbi:hypothetical protein D3C75_1006770 [compost metagenome]
MQIERPECSCSECAPLVGLSNYRIPVPGVPPRQSHLLLMRDEQRGLAKTGMIYLAAHPPNHGLRASIRCG